MTKDSDKIIDGLKNGNRSVFEELYRQYYLPLCYYCVKYVENLEDAEEIVQEVFFKLWEKHADIDISSSVNAYLHRAVQNNALNYINKKKIVDRFVVSHDKNSNYSFDDGQKAMEDEELRLILKKAILELPEKRREIFELSRFDGLKYSSIAEQLSISVKTVESQMTKALKHLRIVLKDYTPFLVIAVELYKNIGGLK